MTMYGDGFGIREQEGANKTLELELAQIEHTIDSKRI